MAVVSRRISEERKIDKTLIPGHVGFVTFVLLHCPGDRSRFKREVEEDILSPRRDQRRRKQPCGPEK